MHSLPACDVFHNPDSNFYFLFFYAWTVRRLCVTGTNLGQRKHNGFRACAMEFYCGHPNCIFSHLTIRRSDGTKERGETTTERDEKTTERGERTTERRYDGARRRYESTTERGDGATERRSEAKERERRAKQRATGRRRRSDGTTERGDGATIRYYFSFVIKSQPFKKSQI